ncbi:hypothetical protein CDO52_26770 [Nocardiopsis gilva YIM 90087]|uniref:DUF7691 domain-containing protein n=2 Tax=Nocardiopsis gilva TaxID=280236 RepID=A0A223SCU2_9ACTN|nr:hypothetical protein CDO52_26770 [Nocardiopsis gilva YIM 90087]
MAYSVDLARISHAEAAPYRSQCERYGEFLPNAPFYPVRFWWFAEVDRALADLGVKAVRLDDLWMGAEDGAQWSTEEVRRAAVQARAVTTEQVQALEDYSICESVQTVLGWIRGAAEQGHGIVGFYH